MKNIQIIEGSTNCVFEIYRVSEIIFNKIFKKGQDVIFQDKDIANLMEENEENTQFWSEFYKNRADKKTIHGIHGTLHLGSSYCKSEFFPNRKEIDVSCMQR